MAALDDPERYSFTRADGPIAPPSVMARWTDTLTGLALTRYLARTGVLSGQKALAAYRQRRSMGGMRFGLTRGGKPIDASGDQGNR